MKRTLLLLTFCFGILPSQAFEIGLSMYSLRQLFFDGKLTALEYPAFASKTFGITKIDVWEGGFPKERLQDPEFYRELKAVADKAGSEIFLYMAKPVDARGKTAKERKAQAEKFFYTVDNAKVLGCTFVRVFLRAPNGDRQAALEHSAEALLPLVKYAKKKGITVLIEPGASEWAKQGPFLADLARQMNHSHLRLMPDFGKMKDHDPYGGTEAMMPYTDGVSAKSHDFEANGDSSDFDYARLLKIINAAGFGGIVAIEYEGKKLGPIEGVKATQKLLRRFQLRFDFKVEETRLSSLVMNFALHAGIDVRTDGVAKLFRHEPMIPAVMLRDITALEAMDAVLANHGIRRARAGKDYELRAASHSALREWPVSRRRIMVIPG